MKSADFFSATERNYNKPFLHLGGLLPFDSHPGRVDQPRSHPNTDFDVLGRQPNTTLSAVHICYGSSLPFNVLTRFLGPSAGRDMARNNESP